MKDKELTLEIHKFDKGLNYIRNNFSIEDRKINDYYEIKDGEIERTNKIERINVLDLSFPLFLNYYEELFQAIDVKPTDPNITDSKYINALFRNIKMGDSFSRNLAKSKTDENYSSIVENYFFAHDFKNYKNINITKDVRLLDYLDYLKKTESFCAIAISFYFMFMIFSLLAIVITSYPLVINFPLKSILIPTFIYMVIVKILYDKIFQKFNKVSKDIKNKMPDLYNKKRVYSFSELKQLSYKDYLDKMYEDKIIYQALNKKTKNNTNIIEV